MKKRGMIIIVLCMFLFTAVGYGAVYKPRVDAKNYASWAAICLAGIEVRLDSFGSDSPRERQKTLQSISGIWGKFCEIECPDNPRAEEIQWKMAKLLGYAESFTDQEIRGVYIGTEAAEARQNITERIDDLKWLIDDTIDYGNFKRLK